jgi:hypothetical protein
VSQVEKYRDPLPAEIPEVVRGDWLRIGRLTRVAAASKICPYRWRKDPEGIFAVFWLGHSRGMPVNISLLNRFNNFDGIRPTAQTLLGWIHEAGHHTHWGRHDEEIAELYVDGEEYPFTFSVDNARSAHLLDIWVERDTDSGRKWDDGKPVMETEKFVVANDQGQLVKVEDMPEWAAEQYKAGKLKRKDNWYGYRGDMLMNRACSRAAHFACPEVEMGIDVALATPPPPTIYPERAKPELVEQPRTYDDDDPERPFE